jgi:Family of unknown function (DUF695)/Regulator of ribonuclease activity B
MADNWKPYLCNVNGKLASIFVNLGLRGDVPIAAKPWLLWTWVYFQTPRSDGLSDGKGAPTLYKIEDALEVCVGRTCQATPCGRITTEGRREFYFYGETKSGFSQAVEAALQGFEGYRYDTGCQEDPERGQYLNVLYPSPEDLQRIANMDLLDVLVKKGDVLTVAREVQHWMYFRSESSRSLFRDAAVATGFKVVSEPSSKGNLPFGIVVARTQSIEQNTIDRTVLDLFNLARRFDGDYDGWETPVVTQ